MTHTGKEPSFAKLIEIKDVIPVKPGRGDIDDINKKITLDADLDPADDAGTGKEGGKKSAPRKTGRLQTRSAKISELKEKLKEALKVEDYELAASLRDQIKAYEVKNEKKKK